MEDSVDASIQRLKDYIQKHEEGLITATRNETEKIHGEPRRFAVSHSCEQPPANAGEKNSQIMIIIIDKTQQNSKCWLCGDRDETINHIISEYIKLAQKEYKTRHNWVGNMGNVID